MADSGISSNIPEFLSGELARIWAGWRILGDREIVREASAKGTHIKLAYKFLEKRRCCSQDDARDYFLNEVDIWINELLKKKQIHRASHILKNVGKVPEEYIKMVCLTCLEPELRDYLVQHCEKLFDNAEKIAWQLVIKLKDYESKHNFGNNLISTRCLKDFIDLHSNIKDALYTELYFHSYDVNILTSLKKWDIWRYLLTCSEFGLIKIWIDITYNQLDRIQEIDIINNDLKGFFINNSITEDMLNYIESSEGIPLSNNFILNYLSRYAVFTRNEKTNVKVIISRFLQENFLPADFEDLLCRQSCNFDKDMFRLKIESISLSRNYLENHTIQDWDLKNKQLLESLKKLNTIENFLNDDFTFAIIETIKYLSNSNGNISPFLLKYPIIAFCLTLVYYFKMIKIQKDFKFYDIFYLKQGIVTELFLVSNEVLGHVLINLPYLRNILEEKKIRNDFSMYQILDGYNKINTSKVFKWRYKNGKMPDFSNENLVKKYGFKEKLSFINYLNEARPNMAAYLFNLQQSKLPTGATSKAVFQASLCAHTFALRHSRDSDIVSGCISFLEILGIDSENLRLHIQICNLVHKELDINIENLLESVIYNNQDDLKSIMNYLESCFYSCFNIKLLENSYEFINVLKSWDILIRFARAHKTSLPTLILKFLADKNAWFEFILTVHIFNYPIDQMNECLDYFINPNIKKHLYLGLNNTNLWKQSNESLKLKNDRILKKDKLTEELSDINQQNNMTENIPVTEKRANDDNFTDVRDLWSIILKCHQSQDPPGALLKASKYFRSPILTVLATCYEPSSIASYFFTWMIISTYDDNILRENDECLRHQVWSASRVANLFCDMVSNGYVMIICRGLEIFMPEYSIKFFFEFLEQCTLYGDFQSSKKNLSQFKNDTSHFKCNKIIIWESTDTVYLENIYWIETVIIKCIIACLDSVLTSICTKLEFLHILVESTFYTKFTVKVPNFEALLNFTTILSETKLSLNYLRFDTTKIVDESIMEIERCIYELLKDEDYGNALKISKAANLKSYEVILAQYRNEITRNLEKGIFDLQLWNRCSLDFKKYEVQYEKAAEFFVEHADKVKSHRERYEVLKLALDILEENSIEKNLRDTVEMAMWKSCLLVGPENVDIQPVEDIFDKLKTEVMACVCGLQVSCVLSEINEKDAVESLLKRMLDAGRLETAIRIGVMFNSKFRDLQVLMLCLSLAEGELSPYELSTQQKSLISSSENQHNNILRNRGVQRAAFIGSNSSDINVTCLSTDSTIKSTAKHQEFNDSLVLLTNLVETLKHGIDIGIRILLCYRLSINSGKNYEILLKLSNHIQFLQEMISSSDSQKMEIAKDIIIAYRIDNKTLANFLAEEIVAHITQVIEDESSDTTTAWKYNLNLQSVIELCKDPSLLGMKLYDMANKLLGHSHGEKRNLITLKIIVELLIRSHDAFTTSCNMEGIALILHKCQQLSNSLQNLKHWSLLVRLITGVGRFTEMNYIFRILKENDQFEYLLGRGLDKVPGLRLALLDFVKRNCPEDRDLFTIVALHFRLYNEIALMWKSEAEDIVDKLIKEARKESRNQPPQEIKFTRVEKTEKQLNLAMTNFTHATQYFLQDNILNLANHSSHQAQLVALQISLLTSVSPNQQFPWILKLSSEEIHRAICRFLNFSQTLILARAYNYYVDWASVIYNHCIINGETKYLQDFLISKGLTNSIAVDCVKRYRSEKTVTKAMTDNIKTIISRLKDCECKYVLASQLGFKDVIHDILQNSASGSYLKDTVWKKRYPAECVGNFLSNI